MGSQYIEAIAKLITAFAWPGVVLTFILTQRREIARILRNVRHLKGAGVEAELTDDVEETAESALRAHPDAGKNPPTEQEFRGAMRIERRAADADVAVIRRQITDLAREYEQIRQDMTYSSARTRRMELVVA